MPPVSQGQVSGVGATSYAMGVAPPFILPLSPRAMATLLVRLCQPKRNPVAEAAATFVPEMQGLLVKAFRETHDAVPLGQLEEFLSLGHAGWGGPLHILQETLTHMGDLLLGNTPEEPTALRAAKGKTGLSKTLGKALKGGANASELCVLDTDRVERAKKAHVLVKKAYQDLAEANERVVAQMIGGRALDDNEPMDVLMRILKKQHGLEVKTMFVNKASKITMNKAALKRKIAWKAKQKAVVHTLVLDDRNLYSFPDRFSGNRIYIRKGVGSFTLDSMTPIKDAAHLREFLGITEKMYAQMTKEVAKEVADELVAELAQEATKVVRG